MNRIIPKKSFTALGLSLMIAGPATAATLTASELAQNDLVITEFLANPLGVSDADGEYFEIFNTLPSPVDLAGVVVRDDGSNSFTIDNLTVAAHSFAVFSGSDGTALGISPAYIYGSSMTLTNADDEIGLFLADDTLLHKLSYADGDAFGEGVAQELERIGVTDFVPATDSLPMDNFGSPGTAGNTQLQLSIVPIPGAVVLFGSALGLLAAIRRRALLLWSRQD